MLWRQLGAGVYASSILLLDAPACSALIASFLFHRCCCTCARPVQIEVPNLHVCKLMQSLRSREVVKEKFNWQYLYYTLTDKGIEYLREYLHVSEDTVPATLKKASKPQPPPSFGAGAEGGERGRGGFRGTKNSEMHTDGIKLH